MKKITELPPLAANPPLSSVLPMDDAAGAGPTSKVTVQQLKDAIGTAGPPGPAGATGPAGPSGSAASGEARLSDGLAVEFFDDYPLGALSVFNLGLGFTTDGVASGGTIVSKTMVSGQVQQRLQLIAGQYGRKMPWGNDWGRIRLSVLWRINRGSTFSSLSSYFGICSGTLNMAASATTNNFVGVRPGLNAGDMIFTAGTRMNYIDCNPAWRFVSRRGAITTDQTGGATSAGRAISATEGYLSLHTLEIGRPTYAAAGTSISYSFGRSMTDLTQVEMSLAKTVLMDVLHDTASSTVGGGTLMPPLHGAGNNVVAYAFDESTGEFDTINISWAEAFGLEIAGIGVRKIW